jgi:hypothetical protein
MLDAEEYIGGDRVVHFLVSGNPDSIGNGQPNAKQKIIE